MAICLTACQAMMDQSGHCVSPHQVVEVNVQLDQEGKPFYQVLFQDQMVMDTSYLGFELNKMPDLKKDMEWVGVSYQTFDETWEQPWGEERWIRNHYNEMRVSLKEKYDLKRRLDIVFRLFDDGMGFRYEFPEQEHLRHFEIQNELTEFHFKGDHESWWIPAYKTRRYAYLYNHSSISQIGKAHTPLTIKGGEELYMSIHEAALKDYSSMVLDGSDDQKLTCELVPYSQGEKSRAFVKAPGKTPWRTITLATRPGDLITSYLILNLNEPNQLGDVSWLKLGKYLGTRVQTKGVFQPNQKASAYNLDCIDFAAQKGLDGVVLNGAERNASSISSAFTISRNDSDFDFLTFSQYAREKGISLVSHHETDGYVDRYEKQMQAAFQQLNDHGFQAVKTSYSNEGSILANGKYHHGQAFVTHFHKVIKLAAQHKMAVVVHKPIKDTGERRTFPNIISRKGGRGQEPYTLEEGEGNPPDHQTILPFTRCLAGPMDFAPGVFGLSDPLGGAINTTLAKQLALYVIIYSPIQIANDLISHYEQYPDAFTFIQEVGVDWETTRVLGGEIGQHLTIARKKRGTEDWFVGAITNAQPREIDIPLDFLDPDKKYLAKVYQDGPEADYQTQPESYTIETHEVTSHDHIAARLAASGGVAISLFDLSTKPN
ncbi:MAG: glycoside hydrolase family 97 N-terminal domain-containing protein [Bacteroidota bacterium]